MLLAIESVRAGLNAVLIGRQHSGGIGPTRIVKICDDVEEV